MEFSGVYPVMLTPLTKDKRLDLEGLKSYLEYLIKEGVDGLVCLGSNGEFPYFSLEEKKQIIKAVLEINNRRLPILVGTGCFGTEETVNLSLYAKDAGADGLLLALPLYYPLKISSVYLHYKTVANRVKMPIIFYHFPACTHLRLKPEEIGKICEIDEIVGIKESILNLKEIKNHYQLIKKRPFYIFSGTSYLFLNILKLGGSGLICPIPNILPKECLSLNKSFKKGDFKTAKIFEEKIFQTIPLMSKMNLPPKIAGRVMNMIAKIGIPISAAGEPPQAILKETLRQMGIPILPYVQEPLPQLKEEDKRRVSRFLEKVSPR